MLNRKLMCDRGLLSSLFLLACLFFLAPLGANASDPVVYVSASTQDFITRFDTVTGKSTKLAPAGLNATSFVVSPDGTTAYVTRHSAYVEPFAGIDIFNLTNGELLGAVNPQIADSYTNLALSADGSRLYFVGVGQLQVFDTASQTVIAQVPVGMDEKNLQHALALVTSGSEIYVSSASNLQAFNTQSLMPVAISALPKVTSFDALAASPDGKTLYVATPDSNTIVSVINTAMNTVVANFHYSDEGNVLGLAVSPDGLTLYLAGPKGLFRLSAATGEMLGQLTTTPLSGQIASSPDGKYVYVNRAEGDYIREQPDSLGSNFPGLLQIEVATGAATNLPVRGVAISEQIPDTSQSPLVLQTIPYVSTENPGTAEITGNVGVIGGAVELIASANGAVVAGLSEPTFATDPGSATVSLIDTATKKVTGQFTYTPPAGDETSAYSFTMNGDGSVGFLGLYRAIGPVADEVQVTVLSLPSGSAKAAFSIGDGGYGVGFMAVSPDGATLFSLVGIDGDLVADAEFCSTDLKTYRTIGCFPLYFNSPAGELYGSVNSFALSSDGTRAYIPAYLGQFNGGVMYLIEMDTASLKPVASLDISSPLTNYLPPGSIGILYSSATNSVYIDGPRILDQQSGGLLRVDLGTFTIAARQQVNYVPNGFAVTPDGTKLLVTGSTSGTQIFDGTTLAYTGYIPGGLENGIVIPKQ